MKVSIITATFNSQASLKTCIESVNLQDYENLQHVFIDGNSTDNTLNIIRENSKRNNLIISEDDKGIYDALNKGVIASAGDIIGYVHSDDILAHKSIISDIVTMFKNENIDGVYGDLKYVSKNEPKKVIRYWQSREYHPKLILQGWMPPHPTLYLRRSVYDKFGLFNLRYKISADYDFVIRIMKDKNLKFGYLPKVICDMRVGGASNRSVNNIINKTREDYCSLLQNDIKNPVKSVILKNIHKIPQFFKK
ncbi:glycosyltransferase [Flavobacteriaceae bacterium MAR_2010_188]|nr:glycosyltransferase [Flavobacteriaceae bacterium MAR_2010_188]